MSNRRERRARARQRGEHPKPGTSTLRVPDGTLVQAQVLRSTGEVAEVTNFRQIPAKRAGVHRWQVFITHYLTPEQAEAFARRGDAGRGPVLLDPSSVTFAALGCIDCEAEYDEAAPLCPAGDEWGQR